MAKYYLSCVFCYRRSLTIDWIWPSTTWAVCFVTGDHCCWLLTEQGQVLPELCDLFFGDHCCWLPTQQYYLNSTKYYRSFVLCFRRSLATDWTRPSTTWAGCSIFWRWVSCACSSTGCPIAWCSSLSPGAPWTMQRKSSWRWASSFLFFSLCKMDVSLLDGAYVCVCESMFSHEWERVLYLVCTLNEYVCVRCTFFTVWTKS